MNSPDLNEKVLNTREINHDIVSYEDRAVCPQVTQVQGVNSLKV